MCIGLHVQRKPLFRLAYLALFHSLKDLFNANACRLVLIYDTLIITYVAKRISKYVSYIL